MNVTNNTSLQDLAGWMQGSQSTQDSGAFISQLLEQSLAHQQGTAGYYTPEQVAGLSGETNDTDDLTSLKNQLTAMMDSSYNRARLEELQELEEEQERFEAMLAMVDNALDLDNAQQDESTEEILQSLM